MDELGRPGMQSTSTQAAAQTEPEMLIGNEGESRFLDTGTQTQFERVEEEEEAETTDPPPFLRLSPVQEREFDFRISEQMSSKEPTPRQAPRGACDLPTHQRARLGILHPRRSWSSVFEELATGWSSKDMVMVGSWIWFLWLIVLSIMIYQEKRVWLGANGLKRQAVVGWRDEVWSSELFAKVSYSLEQRFGVNQSPFG